MSRSKEVNSILDIGVGSVITSVLSERPLKSADQKTERGKILNPQYIIFRDQPTAEASPLRINTLLCAVNYCDSLSGSQRKFQGKTAAAAWHRIPL